MKKNRGQKPLRNVNKGDDNPKHWKDSNGNHKYLCLHCLKSMKSPSKCCGFEMYNLGSVPRTPKINAPKREWKRFFSLFVCGTHCKNKEQIKKVIERQKFYGLSTHASETALNKLENKIENDIIGVLDIKRHEAIEFYNSHNSSYSDIVGDINKIADRYNTQYSDLTQHKEYFLVPIFSYNYSHYYIPNDIKKFNIHKCRVKSITQKYSTKQTKALTILTNNVKEIVEIGYSPNSQYGYRQKWYLFESKVNAMAFRQEFLTIVFPLLKELEVPYIKELVDTVNLDFERVVKKAPQILI